MSEASAAPLSKPSLDTLIDLVEIKLSTIEVFDRDDAREVAGLERCLVELTRIARGEAGQVAEAEPSKRRGRRPRRAGFASPTRMMRPALA